MADKSEYRICRSRGAISVIPQLLDQGNGDGQAAARRGRHGIRRAPGRVPDDPSRGGPANPTYRAAAQLGTEQTCYVCGEVMPAGTTGVAWSSRRRACRHQRLQVARHAHP